jgi:hypothetical protein
MKLKGVLTIDAVIDWLRFQEEKGLTLKDCIKKLEEEELPKTEGYPRGPRQPLLSVEPRI